MIEKYFTLKNLKILNIVSISILSIAIIISGGILKIENPDAMDGGMGFVMIIGYAIIAILFIQLIWRFAYLSRNNANSIFKKIIFYLCSLICFLMAIYLIYCFLTVIITGFRPGGYI
jgi:hypothetical protein